MNLLKIYAKSQLHAEYPLLQRNERDWRQECKRLIVMTGDAVTEEELCYEAIDGLRTNPDLWTIRHPEGDDRPWRWDLWWVEIEHTNPLGLAKLNSLIDAWDGFDATVSWDLRVFIANRYGASLMELDMFVLRSIRLRDQVAAAEAREKEESHE